MTSGLPVISELSSGCFQVKSAPQFSRSGYHDLDAQKIQALAIKKPCQRSASLVLCDRKLQVEISCLILSGQTSHSDVTRPTASAADCKTALVVSKRRSCVQAVIRRRWRMQNLPETHVSVLPQPCVAAGRASIDEL